MIKYFVNEKKNKVTAYFSDNSDYKEYKGKALWKKYLLDTMPKIFDLYNSFIYIEANELIDSYLKDVNVTCVVTFNEEDDIETAKEIAKERLVKKFARCENVILMHIMKKLHSEVIEIEKRVSHRLVKNIKKIDNN